MTTLLMLMFVYNAISLINALQIASFNVQIFGVKKTANADVMTALVKVDVSCVYTNTLLYSRI